MEFIFAMIGFAILALISWYTDRVKKAKDYYDGDDVG